MNNKFNFVDLSISCTHNKFDFNSFKKNLRKQIQLSLMVHKKFSYLNSVTYRLKNNLSSSKCIKLN